MSVNTHPETGIRYGVIALNKINSDIANELWNGTNVSYEMAVEEVKAQAEADFQDIEDPEESEEEYVDRAVENAEIEIEIEEPTIAGTYEDVKYQITWLGGAPLLWVLEGPVGTARSLCSPCVPNAADLDSGFEIGVGLGHECYVIPKEWLE